MREACARSPAHPPPRTPPSTACVQAHKAYLDSTDHRAKAFQSLQAGDAQAARVIEQRMRKLARLQARAGGGGRRWPARAPTCTPCLAKLLPWRAGLRAPFPGTNARGAMRTHGRSKWTHRKHTTMQEDITAWRAKTAAAGREWGERNGALRKEKELMGRHYAQLKAGLDAARCAPLFPSARV